MGIILMFIIYVEERKLLEMWYIIFKSEHDLRNFRNVLSEVFVSGVQSFAF